MPETASQSSHQQILKATGLLGGAQIVEIVVKMARNKIIATLMGPAGVGIIGLYQATIDLVQKATGFGLDFSAVRDIAEAAGTDDQRRIGRAVVIVRRWVWFTGVLGMVVTLVFRNPLSQYAFGDHSYGPAIGVISLVVLLNAVSGGQLALLQGLRRVGTLAQARVWSVVVAFAVTVPLYFVLGVDGIVPAIVVTAAIGLAFSWYYSRKIGLQVEPVRVKETVHDGLGMVRLGFFTVVTGFATTAGLYSIRAFLSQRSGIDAVGQFQAAWSLSSLYLAAVLQAMATDYFPRLSAVNNDNSQVNRLANEQTEVALLVAAPIIVGMLSFVNLVVVLLYSAEFTDTVRILHWVLAGTLLKVIAWPLGFIILAKGRGLVFVGSELSSLAMLVLPIFLLWDKVGIEITGIAYLFAYLCCIIIVAGITRVISGFGWTRASLRQMSVLVLFVLAAFITSRHVDGLSGYAIGAVLTLGATGYSYYELRRMVDFRALLNRFSRR